jgi:hypothetical protein
VQVVDQARLEVLPNGRRTPADPDVVATGRVERPLESGLDPVVDEVEDGLPPS